jgi:hypothetical protein
MNFDDIEANFRGRKARRVVKTPRVFESNFDDEFLKLHLCFIVAGGF